MSDKYGYIGIETLLAFCSNQKDHCVTPNDFMRMNRVKMPTVERPRGEWTKLTIYESACSCCKNVIDRQMFVELPNFCPNCGADMREGE